MAANWLTWASLAAVAVAFALTPPDRRLTADATRLPRRSALILNGPELAGATYELSADGLEVVFRRIDELAFTIEAGAIRVHETATGRDLADFTFVQLASFPSPTGTLLNAVVAYLRHHGVDAVNAGGIGAPTKLLQYVRFAQAGMAVPATRYLPPRLLADAYPDLADQFGLPFVLTALRGGAGRRERLIRDKSSFIEAMRAAEHAHFLAMEFIPADTTYQLLVLGHEVPIVVRQSISFGESSLASIPPGGQGALIDSATFSPTARALGVQAASLMGLDVADVQIVRHWTTGEWYVLDTSATPLASAGALIPDKVSAYTAYLQRKLGAETEQDGSR